MKEKIKQLIRKANPYRTIIRISCFLILTVKIFSTAIEQGWLPMLSDNALFMIAAGISFVFTWALEDAIDLVMGDNQ